jgi:glycosyltransferase involved in cell wall biosynthesis
VSESLERLACSPLPRVLFVSHAFGGGVGRHIDDLARALRGDAEVILVQPFLRSYLQLRWLRAGEALTLWFHAGEDWERLVQFLAAIGIDRVHYHHIHGWPQAVLELPARLDCGYDITLHDFFPACPEYHFTAADARFCGGGAQCHRCHEARAPMWPLSIDAWRALFAGVLKGAGRVIAPSSDAARRLATFFPDAGAEVWPHIDETAATPAPPLRILVPGAISPEKGLGLLEACIADAAERALPLHFRVLGYTARPIAPWPLQPYSVTGEYPEGRLAELLALERGDAVFFPAQCPETFSYTLSDCLDTPLAIVATDLGALPERLAGRANARIVPWDSTARAVNDVFMEIARPSQPATHNAGAVSAQSYRGRYVEALDATGRSARAAPPALEPRWLAEPVEALPPWTLAALFDDAIGCGRASSLEILRRKTREADAELEAARSRPAPAPPAAAGEPASSMSRPLRAFARLLKR